MTRWLNILAVAALAMLLAAHCNPDPRRLTPLSTSSTSQTASTRPSRHEGPGRVYDAACGYSFELPEGYHKEKAQLHLATYLGPWEMDFTVNLNIDVFAADFTSMQQAGPRVRRVLNLLLKNYRVIEDGLWTIDGKECYHCSGTFDWQGRTWRNQQVFLRGGSQKLYVFTFATTPEGYEARRAVFENCARTIRVD